MIIVTSSFTKSSIFKMFSVHTKTDAKPAFSNSSGLKSVFEKLCFRDGLVWTVGLTLEKRLRFQMSPGKCGRRDLKGAQSRLNGLKSLAKLFNFVVF